MKLMSHWAGVWPYEIVEGSQFELACLVNLLTSITMSNTYWKNFPIKKTKGFACFSKLKRDKEAGLHKDPCICTSYEKKYQITIEHNTIIDSSGSKWTFSQFSVFQRNTKNRCKHLQMNIKDELQTSVNVSARWDVYPDFRIISEESAWGTANHRQ